MDFPPPHYLLFEPLNDKETLKQFNEYKKKYSEECEFEEIDACTLFSSDTFSTWFDNWISKVPLKTSTRFRVLLIWHAEFLTFACQQMLRRQLEKRSFKNRVWFHVENPTTIQNAIISRCITKRMPTIINHPEYKYDSDIH